MILILGIRKAGKKVEEEMAIKNDMISSTSNINKDREEVNSMTEVKEEEGSTGEEGKEITITAGIIMEDRDINVVVNITNISLNKEPQDT